MSELTPGQRRVLGLICDNYRRGLVLASSTTLPPQQARIVNNLRKAGLVEPGCYRPTPPALGNQAIPARPKSRRNGTTSSWTAEVKETFLRALEGGAMIPEALVAAGFSDQSRKGAFKVKGEDLEFARRWQAAISSNRATRLAAEKRRRSAPPPPSPPGASPVPPPAPAMLARQAEPPAPPPSTFTPPPVQPRRSEADICRAALAHQAEQRRIRELRPPMSVDEAKLILQRAGRVVYRASVNGGRADRWRVSGFAEPIDDAMLKHEAERLQKRDQG